MKIIQNKNLIQKIFVILLMILCFNFVCPIKVHAAESFAERLGGALLRPIADLLVSIGDAIVQVSHNLVIYDMAKDTETQNKMEQETLIEMDFRQNVWQVIGAILIGILAVAAIITITAVTGGLAGLIGGAAFGATALSTVTAGTILTAIVGGVTVGYVSYNSMALGTHYYLPTYVLSPEEIFQDKIPLFNINFFEEEGKRNAKYDLTYAKELDISGKSLYGVLAEYGLITMNNPSVENYYRVQTVNKHEYPITTTTETHDWKENGVSYKLVYIRTETNSMGSYSTYYSGSLYKNGAKIYSVVDDWNFTAMLEDTIKISTARKMYENVKANYSINESNDPQLLRHFTDCYAGSNSFEWEDNNGNKYKLSRRNETNKLELFRKYVNIGSELQSVVAKWYVTLRNLALVISLSILVYVGIRMLLTGVAADKAKYKNMLFDWLVGVALLFVMQYIMVFSITLVNEFIEMINLQSTPYITAIEIEKKYEKDVMSQVGEKYFIKEKADGNEIISRNAAGNAFLAWPTNLMGVARLNAQINRDTGISYVGYVLVFLILVFYTIFFVFTYLKRVLYMVFLTIIAPMVAMTYPLDKLSDGKAQAFNMWLKEYIFNLMIQPFHLLLYTVLISSAMDLAKQSILYSLVAIGFLMPAEKLLRKFFGFDKAQTPGFLGGAAGAALTMSAVGSLNKFAKGGDSHGEGKSSSENKINYSRQKLPGNSFSMEGIRNGDMKGGSESKGTGQSKAPKYANNNPSHTDKGKSNSGDNGSLALKEFFPADYERINEEPKGLPNSYGDESIGASYRELSEGESNAVVPYSSTALDFPEEEQDGIRYDYPDAIEADFVDKSDANEPFSADMDTDSMSLDDELRSRGVGEELEAAFDETKLENENENEKERAKKDAERAERKARRHAVASTMGYYAKESFKKSASKAIMNAPSKLLRGAARFTGAGVLGAIGLAAGIASGDPNNILKMGGAGLATGSAVGAGLANRAGVNNIGKPDYEMAEELERARLGDKEYIRRKNEKLDKQFLNNPGSRSLYRGKFSGFNEEEVTAVMQRSLEYKNKGLTDDKTIIELIKKEQDYKGKDFITGKDKKIDGYVEGLAGLVKDIKSPKDIDRVVTGLDRNEKLTAEHKERIIQDLYDITGFKRVK